MFPPEEAAIQGRTYQDFVLQKRVPPSVDEQMSRQGDTSPKISLQVSLRHHYLAPIRSTPFTYLQRPQTQSNQPRTMTTPATAHAPFRTKDYLSLGSQFSPPNVPTAVVHVLRFHQKHEFLPVCAPISCVLVLFRLLWVRLVWAGNANDCTSRPTTSGHYMQTEMSGGDAR